MRPRTELIAAFFIFSALRYHDPAETSSSANSSMTLAKFSTHYNKFRTPDSKHLFYFVQVSSPCLLVPGFAEIISGVRPRTHTSVFQLHQINDRFHHARPTYAAIQTLSSCPCLSMEGALTSFPILNNNESQNQTRQGQKKVL